jgi:hypothetical protein
MPSGITLRSMRSKPIYVEILIRAPLEEVWEKTQRPELHQRWDLRFTGIDYLPRPNDDAPQDFRYSTRIGFGLGIEGYGQTLGERVRPDGSRVSSLRFWSDQRISLIKEGSGYWRYVPTSDGVRFLTWYDYRVRFGAPGRLIDAAVFRPLVGWATAWSFDRLRRWIEEETPPEALARQGLLHCGSRAALAVCWVYQGLVPKLIAPDSGEKDILSRLRGARGRERGLLSIIGLGEVGLGAAQLSPRAMWPIRLTLVALPVLAAGALRSQPGVFIKPFNPASLTVSMGALAAVALGTRSGTPSARACLRKQPASE